MTLRLQEMVGWEVEVAGPAPGLHAAAADLRSVLGAGSASGRVLLRIRPGPPGSAAMSVGAGALTITGADPASVSAALYLALEELGVIWPEPGLPPAIDSVAAEALEDGSRDFEFAFPERTLVLGQDALHDDWREWAPWAARCGFTALFFHDTPPSRDRPAGTTRPQTAEGMAADGGGWMFERFDDDGPAIRDALRQRGLSLVFGGHHLTAMVPRGEFERHPDWFTERRGQRDPRHNFCTASADARQALERNVERFVGRFPGARTYHLWADDIRGGGWCSCSECAAWGASDQALRATNFAAEAIASAAPAATIAHLAYHDTVQPPQVTEPGANVELLWAPRERCYAHAIDDPGCRNRREYWEPYQGLAAKFGAARMQLFEYYSDAILFKGLAPPHLATLPGDARAYAGAAEYQDLMVGDRPWVGPPWHAWWFARTAMGQGDVDLHLLRFCRAAFGPAAAAAERWYRESEVAYRLLLDLHDLQPLARHDVLDFSDTPLETLTTKAAELLEASDRLGAAADSLMSASASGEHGARLERERTQAGVVVLLASHLAHRTAAWSAALAGSGGDAREHLARAEEALSGVAEWDAVHNTPAYGNVTVRMRAAMAWHVAEVARLS